MMGNDKKYYFIIKDVNLAANIEKLLIIIFNKIQYNLIIYDKESKHPHQ